MKALPEDPGRAPGRPGCWSPGRGDEEEAVEGLPDGAALAGRVPRHGQRRGQGAAAAQRRPVRRAQHRRRELRHHPGRGACRRAPRCWPATWTRSPRSWTRARRANCSPTRTPTRWPTAAVRLLGDPARRAELRERGSAHVRRFDWSTVGADILAVYETVTDGAAWRRTSAPTATTRWGWPGTDGAAAGPACGDVAVRPSGGAAAARGRGADWRDRRRPVALPPVTATLIWIARRRSSRSAST